MPARWYIRKGYIEARGLDPGLEKGHGGYHRLLHQGSFDAAYNLWKSVDPKSFILNNQNGEIRLRAHYNRSCPNEYVLRYSKDTFRVPSIVQSWIDENVYGDLSRPKSLILWGASRLGKKEFARVIDKHWYMCTDWDVTQVNADSKYGVIDDIPSERFLYWKSFLGYQRQFTVTDKFYKKQIIWGKPVIWLSNDDPRKWKGVDYEWICANSIIVNVVSISMYT